MMCNVKKESRDTADHSSYPETMKFFTIVQVYKILSL